MPKGSSLASSSSSLPNHDPSASDLDAVTPAAAIFEGDLGDLALPARLGEFERAPNTRVSNSGRSAAVFIKDYGNKTVKALNHASSEYLTSAHGGVLSPRGLLLLGARGDSKNFIRDSNNLNLDQISIKILIQIQI